MVEGVAIKSVTVFKNPLESMLDTLGLSETSQKDKEPLSRLADKILRALELSSPELPSKDMTEADKVKHYTTSINNNPSIQEIRTELVAQYNDIINGKPEKVKKANDACIAIAEKIGEQLKLCAEVAADNLEKIDWKDGSRGLGTLGKEVARNVGIPTATYVFLPRKVGYTDERHAEIHKMILDTAYLEARACNLIPPELLLAQGKTTAQVDTKPLPPEIQQALDEAKAVHEAGMKQTTGSVVDASKRTTAQQRELEPLAASK